MAGEDFNKEKIKSKIQKLLNLAGNNPNPAEAEQAMLKAQAMLLEYKIEMHELQDDEPTKIVSKISNESANTPWARQLAHLLAKNFRCMIYYNKWMASMNPVFFGEEDDADVCSQMYDYAVVWLNKAACNYATRMRNTKGIVKGVKQDFILGFLAGLENKFKSQVEQNATYTLAVIVPPQVHKEYIDMSVNMKKAQFNESMKVHGSIEARAAGYQAGMSFGTDRFNGGN